ncbi:Ig-like domain-containing protein [Bartonella sp. HY328]|uniref:Ig-like domain-containing protein n=1 Tax=Bartonella sp. HY328 TaxID=2979320 RepID=UPI0021C8EE27|nr:Ig-like domain-containing protein [Bartonella sp. HY328]UXN09362.1 Ig-like domain-containing protein [Bartonella sp. HY328]
MTSKSVLNNHVDTKITSKSGVVNASNEAGNFYIDAAKGDIANYAREGGDLVIEFKDGEKLVIKNFFTYGLEFNNLLLSGGEVLLLVDFTKALSGQDGIEDPDVIYHELNDGIDATAVLLGLLGAGALAAGVSGSSGSDSDQSPPPVVDNTPPAVPSLSSVYDSVEAIIGDIANGDSTNDARPTFSGTAAAGSTIKFYDNGQFIGSTVADSNGNWSWQPDTDLVDGAHSITYTASDSAGNESAHSNPFEFTVDTQAPNAPSAPNATDNAEPFIGTIESGGSTNDNQPEFSGKGEPGSTITVKDGDTIIGETTVDSDGNWTFKPQTPLGEGSHSITVTETDKAGNQSDSSAPIEFEVDTIKPSTPSTPNAADNAQPFIGTIESGGSTNDNQPEFSGKGEAGATVTIKDGDTIIGETTVDSDGNWTFKPETPLGDGSHSITVTETDKAGNQSDSSTPIEFEVDTTPPAAIDETLMDLVDDFGLYQGTIAHGGPTDDHIPTYSGGVGSIDPNDASSINIYNKDVDGNVTLIGTTTVNADGSWSFDPNPSLGAGDYIFTARPVDKVGNIGPETSGWNFTVFGDAPQNPAITNVTDNEGAVVGELQKDGVTDDTTPVVTGTGETGSVITIYVQNPDGTSFIGGTTVVNADGVWSLEISPAFAQGDGTYTISAQAHDAAGQLSAMTGGYPVILDTLAPNAPQQPILTDNVGDVTGALSPNDTTDDKQPVLSGNVGSEEAGGTITIKDGDTVIGTTTVEPDGSWSFTPPALSEGNHSITVTVTDLAGNESKPSPSFDLTVDTSNVEVSFSHFVDNVGSIQGNVDINGVSDDRTPVMVGNATANTTITISYINGDGEKIIVGVTTADSNGAWTLTPTTEFSDGTYGFTAEAVNAAGTKDDAYFNIEIDATAPTAPIINEVLDDVGFIQGPISSGSSTDDTTPSFSGTAEAGTTITIKDSDGTIVGQTTVDDEGNWSLTTDPLAEGSHNLSITATDTAGNESTGTGFDVTIDTQGPTATAELGSISDDSGFDSTDFVTNDTTLIYTIRINGDIEAGDTVWMRIKPDGGASGEWIQATRNDDGTYSVNHNDAAHSLADGRYTIETIIRDAAGNPSEISSQAITIDTQGPTGAIVAISGYFDDVGAITGTISQSGTSSDDTTPLLKGTISGLQDGDRIIIKVTDAAGVTTILGEATVNNGVWEYQVTDSQAFAEGDYHFEAVVTDNAGNEGSTSNSFAITIDVTPPSAINNDSLDLIDDFGPLQGSIQSGDSTDDRTPTYSGAAGSVDADDVATINIYNEDAFGDIHLIGLTTVNADGSWTFDPNPPLTPGDYIFTARPVDKAGNEGPATTEWNFTVVGAAPADPAITSVGDNQAPVTGNLQQNGVTDDTTPVVRGTGTAGSTITIYVTGPNGESFTGGTTIVGSNGVWTLEINPAFDKGDGQYVIQAQASDIAGQLSNITGGYPIVLDTSAPATPSLPTITDNVGDVIGALAPDGTTDDSRPVISGQEDASEAGGTITIKDGDTVLGTTTINPDGSWSFTPPALSEGDHTITITVTDQAGNESNPSDGFDIHVDTSNVVVSFDHFVDNVDPITGNIDNGGISNDRTPQMVGKATANAVVTVSYVDSNGTKIIVGTTSADSTGAWSLTPSTDLIDGNYGFMAEAVNAAGTKGNAYFTINIDGTAPAAPVINDVLDDVGFIQGAITSGSSTDDTTPTFTGSGEVGATITIKDEDGNVVGQTTVAGDGTWSITTNPLAEGNHSLTVTATDQAGNESSGVGFDVTIDTTAPTSTAILQSISDDSGFNNADFVTNDPTLIYTISINGTLETGDTVWMRIRSEDGSVGEWIKAVDNGDGTYSIDHNDAAHSLADGNYVIETIVRDAAGNSSAISSQIIIIDTTAPNDATVTISGYFDNVGAITGNITQSGSSSDDKTPLLKGTIAGLETGDRVIIKVTGSDGITKILGEATVSAGTWQYQVSDAQAFLDGDYTFEAVVTDNAGNEGSKSNSFKLNIDTVAPSAIDTTKLDLVDDFGPVQGTINRGDSTDDHTPTYKGAAGSVDPADASKINIYNKGSDGTLTLIGSTTVNADGSWSFDPQTALTAGDYIFVARPVDKAGNEGDATPDWNFTVVGAAPSIPVISRIVDNVGDVTGDLQRNEVTDDTTPTLHGTGSVGSTITIHVTAPDGSTFIGGTTVVAADGSWTLEINPAFAKGDGTYTIAAQASDAAGQLSGMTTGYPIELDTTAPSTPSIPTITDNVGETTGVLAPNDTTDDKRPVISGNAGVGEAGGVVTIKDGDTVLGTTTINADGSWSYTPPALSEGSHSISVTITDSAGNTSNASESFDLIVDTTEVVVSFDHFVDSVGSITGNVATGGITDDQKPVFNGNATPNATVTVSYVNSDGQTVIVGTTTANSDGTWTLTPTENLADGSYSFTAEAKNAAGNTITTTFTLEVDATAPQTPALPVATDNAEPNIGVITSGSDTNDKRPQFSGTGEVGSTITIKDGDTVLGTTTVDSEGNWSFMPDTPLSEGSHSITVTETDTAGNASNPSPSLDFNVDTTAPATPAVPTANDNTEPKTGVITAGSSTNETKPVFTGTGEVGSTITIKDGDTVIGTTTVDSDGNWSLTPSTALSEGNHSITVTETDKAGNASEESAALDFTVDTTAPATPAVPTATDNTEPNTGVITAGSSTNETQPEFSGTGEVGSIITIKDGDTIIGETTVDSDGNWSLTPNTPLSEGDHSITVTATDAAGNASDSSASLDFNIDTTAPNAIDESKLDLVDDFGTIQGTINRGDPTDDRTPTYDGAAGSVDPDDASTINIYNKDAEGNVTLIGTTTVNADGSWSFDPSPQLIPGDYILSARPVDKAGNIGPATTDWNFTVVGAAPSDPAITSVSDNEGAVTGGLQQNGVTDDTTPVVGGTGTAGSTITIHVTAPDGTSFIGGTTIVDSNGNWTLEISPAFAKGDGTYTIKAQANDAAGQLSNMTGGYPIVLDTTAPSTPSMPTITDNVGDVTGALSPNDTTDDKQPVLSGNAGVGEAGGIVTIKDGDTVLGTTTINADGSWSYSPSALADGDHSISITVTDPAGNTSAASPSFDFTVDSSNVIVGFDHFVDDFGSIQGNVGNNGVSDDRRPQMVGSTSANATVTVSYVNSDGQTVVVGVTTADSNGVWTLTPTTDFADGVYSFTANAENAAGTKGSVIFGIEIDGTAPAAPVIDEVRDDVGFIQGAITSGSSTDDTTPTFSGSGEVGATITIKDSDGNVVGTTTVGSDGKWSVTTDPLTEGDHSLTVTATDAAGNESTGTGFDVTIDTQGPTTTATLQSISDDTGTSASDFITNDPSLIYTIAINGTLQAGDTVWIRIKPEGGTVGQWIEATRNDDGTYSVNHNDASHALSDGNYIIETIVRDAAGNPSTSSTQNITIDTQGPTSAVVTISGYYDDVGSITGEISQTSTSTDDTKPLLKGTISGLEDGDRVIIKVTGADGITKVLGVATVTNGTWEYQVTDAQALAEGNYSFEAVVTDNAGNEGSKSASFDLNIDTTAPNAIDESKLDLVDDFGTIQGTINRGDPTDDRTPTYDGAAGSVDPDDASTINIYNKDAEGNVTLIGTTTVNADGSWSFDPSPQLIPGDYILSARPVDKAGNIGPATTDWNFTVVGAAPSDPAITSVSDNEGAVTGGLQQNGVTDDTTPVVGGTGTAGSTITIHVTAPDGTSFIGGTTIVAMVIGPWKSAQLLPKAMVLIRLKRRQMMRQVSSAI